MRIGDNVRQRKDGRYEARYYRSRDENGRIIYGYAYGKTYEEAAAKREEAVKLMQRPKVMNLLILGAGSHGQEVYEIASSFRKFHTISFLDDNKTGPEILGKCSEVSKFLDTYPIAIPAVGDNQLRKLWMQDLEKKGFIIPNLCHSSANVSGTCQVGTGTVICAGATIGAMADIGKGCIIDSGAVIERGAKVHDWTWIDCGQIVTRKDTQ